MGSLARGSVRQPSGCSAKRFAGPSLDLAQLPLWEELIHKIRTKHSVGGCTAPVHSSYKENPFNFSKFLLTGSAAPF